MKGSFRGEDGYQDQGDEQQRNENPEYKQKAGDDSGRYALTFNRICHDEGLF
jgi:hypothetical protein